MEQWCTRRLCLQNQNSQKNYGRKGKPSPLGTEGLLKLKYVNVLKFEKSQKSFSFFTLTPSQIWLKRPVYRGFNGEGKCEGRAFTLTPALTLPSHFRHRIVYCQGFYLQNLTKVPEKYSCLVPTVQHRYTNSIAMLHYQYSYAGLSV